MSKYNKILDSVGYEQNTVSIIVPIYNCKDYLPGCIESIVAQTYNKLQIILVDDGSTDQSASICEKYCLQDERIQVIKKDNGGVSSARNAGLANAVGEYISFIDSDDWIEKEYIERLLGSIRENQSDCSMCEHDVFDKQGSIDYPGFADDGETVIYSERALTGLCFSLGEPFTEFPFFYLWDKLYKHQLWENIKFDESLHNGEDRWALFEVFKKIKNGLSLVRERLYHYRDNREGSITSNKDQGCDYEIAYRMLDNARFHNMELTPFIENVVIHTLGRLRRACLEKNYDQYYSTYQEFLSVYPMAKSQIRRAKGLKKMACVSIRYIPKVVYRFAWLYH